MSLNTVVALKLCYVSPVMELIFCYTILNGFSLSNIFEIPLNWFLFPLGEVLVHLEEPLSFFGTWYIGMLFSLDSLLCLSSLIVALDVFIEASPFLDLSTELVMEI